VLAFIAFVSLGLPDTVLGVAWSSIRRTFGQPLDAIGLLLAGGIAGYLISSFFSGTVVRKIGVGKLLLFSSLLVTIALIGGAVAPSMAWMTAIALISGLGAGAIDAGINAFGASHFSPRIMNWLHACWGIGATLTPAMMTALLSAQVSWRIGYVALASVLGLLTILFLVTLNLWDNPSNMERSDDPPHAGIIESLGQPVIWMQAVLFCLCCGIESTAGQLLFSVFTESRGLSVGVAGSTIAGYWASLTVGRIVFGQLSTRLSTRTVLHIATSIVPVASLLIALNHSTPVSILGTMLLGFGLAPIFPTLMSVTPARVGERFAAQSVGFQVSAAAVGIAGFPSVMSAIARRNGLESVCWFLLLAGAVLAILNERIDARIGSSISHAEKTRGNAELPNRC